MIRSLFFLPALIIWSFCQAHGHDHSNVALQFHENKGQWPSQVLYRALTPGGAIFLEPAAFTYVLSSGGEREAHGRPGHVIEPLKMHAFRVHFDGGSAQAHRASHKMPHYVNYFLGNDQSKWASGIGVYAQVELQEVYPGIGLRVDGHSGMKYDWLVAAGADPSSIIMRYDGQDGLSVEGGLLYVSTTAGNVIEQRPVAWQDINGVRIPVPCEYALKNDRVTFHLPDGHDRQYPLVIDPQVIFSSFSGATGDNFGFTATYDASGHLYGGGMVRSPGYPVTTGVVQPDYGGGENDIAISKFTPVGNALVWSTYIGGSGNEVPHSMVVNSNDELYVLGTTNSFNFPVTSDAFMTGFNGGNPPPFPVSSYGFSYSNGCDMIVTHLNNTATALIGSTFIGGLANDGLNQQTPLNRNYGDPFRGEIILDQNQMPMVCSTTASSGLFTSPNAPQADLAGGLDAYIFRMDPQLSTMTWATYYGGSGTDAGYGIQVSSIGEIFITGGTTSTNLPMAGTPFSGANSGGVDGYIARFHPSGSPLLSTTYLGTTGYDQSYFVQLNTADEVFVVGQTTGNYPVTPGKYANPQATQFLHKFSTDLSTSLWSTRIGGQGNENLSPSAFLVSICGQIYFSGWGGSTQSSGEGGIQSSTLGLPVTPDAFQTTTTGSDFYLMMLEPEAVSLGYATFFGGASAEHVDGGTSRFDKNGIVYQAVCAGCGGTNSFPTTPGAWSETNNSSNCNLGVFKIDFEQSVQVAIQVSATELVFCLGEPVVFTAVGSANTWTWDLGDGTALVTGSPVEHVYAAPGVYDVILVGVDSASCNFADTATVQVNIVEPAVMEASFELETESTCQGYSVTLVNTSTGTNTFIWDFGDGTSGTENSPTHAYQLPGEYVITLFAVDPICMDTVLLVTPIVLDQPFIEIDLPDIQALCDSASIILDAGPGFNTYVWSTGAFTQTIEVTEPGTYSVNVGSGICFGTDTISVYAQPQHAAAEDLVICPGTDTNISPTFTTTSIIWNTGDTTSTLVPTTSGEFWFTAIDEFGCIVQDTIVVEFISTEESLAFIPNVFSPNNDLSNDVFLVGGLSLENYNMEIFNRWGQLMFSSSNPANGWNGGLNNSPDKVPEGTYFYVITYRDRCSQQPLNTYHGHVTVVR